METQLPHKGHSPRFSAHVCCGQTAGWIKMPLGREVRLGPGDIVLDGNSAPPKGAQQHPLFGPCLLWRSSISCWALVFTRQSGRQLTRFASNCRSATLNDDDRLKIEDVKMQDMQGLVTGFITKRVRVFKIFTTLAKYHYNIIHSVFIHTKSTSLTNNKNLYWPRKPVATTWKGKRKNERNKLN